MYVVFQMFDTGTVFHDCVDRASASEAVDSGSMLGWVKSKTIEICIPRFPA